MSKALLGKKLRPMSWSKRIAITLAGFMALILLPVFGLYVLSFYENWQVARFYGSHPMLQEMTDLPTLTPLEVDQKRREVLLKFVPLGSTRSEALRVFSDQGMKCERPVALAVQSMLICTVTSPRSRWHIEVKFDGSDKVSDGRALSLKA